MNGIMAFNKAKKYIQESLTGAGALVGKNVTISSITPINGGNRITFSYTLNDGINETSTLDIMNGKDGEQGKTGENGQNGVDGIGISNIEKINTEGIYDTYRMIFTNGEYFDYVIKNGEQGIQGVKGEQGKQGIQGAKGEKGDDGYPFLIYKEYDSLSEFNSNDFPEIGLLFTTKRNEENNIPVYRYTGEKEMPYSFITNLSENEGIKGEKGEPGKDGIGILNIEKTSTDGLVDTYTITYSDYSTSTFNVTNGKSDDKNVDLSNYLTKEELSELFSKIDYSALENKPIITVGGIDTSTDLAKLETGIYKIVGTYTLGEYISETPPILGEVSSIITILKGENFIVAYTPTVQLLAMMSDDIVQEVKVAQFVTADFVDMQISNAIDNINIQKGESAYELAVKNGFTGNEEEWLKTLKGDKGDQGEPGERGEKGEKGDKGDSGIVTPVVIPNSAATHNAIFRGKDLTNIYSIDEICRRISNGTFEDLYIGDYFDITISTSYMANEKVRCILSGFDIYYNIGDTAFTKHHAVVVPKNCFNKTAPMNLTNTADGGFVGSNIWKTVLPVYKTALQSALKNHILMHRTLLANGININIDSNAGNMLKGASDNWIWVDTYLSLLSEFDIHGSTIFSSSYYEVGCESFQFPLFTLDPTAKVCGKNNNIDGYGDDSRQTYWLRNFAANFYFTCIQFDGHPGVSEVYSNNGIRPIFCIG